MGSRYSNLIRPILIIAILIVVNIIAQYSFWQYDFTEDKRYSLTEPTKDLLTEQDDIIFVKILLEGEFPAGFKRLQRSVSELLNDFRSISPYIEFEFVNPMDGSVSDINQRLEALKQDGIYGVQLRIDEKEGRSQKSIFPYAIFNFGKRKYIVNLLEPQMRGVSDEIWMNNSINLLEYKFANAIQKLKQEDKPTVLFTEGKGELTSQQTARLENKLSQYYQLGRINLDSVVTLGKEADLLIIAKPQQPFTPQNQFLIDQYLMKGGSILWMIDKLNVNLDSINKYKFYVPEPYPLGLDELWFKYGIRIQPNLVQDLESTRIPQIVGMQGDKPQTEMFKWFYHVLVTPDSEHPIVNNLDRINLYSPSSIDTIQTNTEIIKTVLLHSSKYSRYQLSPARITFDILRYEPEVSRFNKPDLPLAVLVEGNFESFFKNKLTSGTKEMLDQIGEEFIEKSESSGKMIFISDGDIAKNLFDAGSEKISPIGFNKWENYAFIGNEDFISNSVEYLIEDKGVLTARSKRIKLRLIDRVKANQQSFFWKSINFIVPIGFLAIFGLLYNYRRKRKYNK